MKQRIFLLLVFLLMGFCSYAQKYADLRSGRHGNRMFKNGEWNEAEVDYRRSLDADTSSLKTSYNLASALYRQQRYEEAKTLLEKNHEALGLTQSACWEFNLGDLALQMEDYETAVQAFSKVVVNCPEDIEAKENYVYAKRMLRENPPDPEQQQNQQNQQDNGQGDGQGDDSEDNQDQNQDQSQNDQDKNNQDQNDQGDNDQPQDQNDQKGNQNPNQRQESQQKDQNLSQQAVDAMLEAIDAKEKDTKEKVDAKKAAAIKGSQKEKNW